MEANYIKFGKYTGNWGKPIEYQGDTIILREFILDTGETVQIDPRDEYSTYTTDERLQLIEEHLRKNRSARTLTLDNNDMLFIVGLIKELRYHVNI